jgi:hypothetical protein
LNSSLSPVKRQLLGREIQPEKRRRSSFARVDPPLEPLA